MKQAPLIALGILVVAVGWIVSGQFATDDDAIPRTTTEPEAPDLPKVRVTQSVVQAHSREIVLLGRTQAERMVDIRAETSGRVETLSVREGALPHRGDVIVELAMDDRAATLRAAQAELAYREIGYDVAKALSKKQFSSQVKLAEEKAALESAKATLAMIQLDISRTRIKAPFDGIIDDLSVEIGDYVTTGGIIANIVDLDPIIVSVEITERDIAHVRIGHVANVLLASDQGGQGIVQFISRSADPVTRTYRAEIIIDNADQRISAGMTAEVSLKTDPAPAHRMSPAVLTLSDDGRMGVKAVDADDHVRFYPVRVIADTPDGIWVSGLPDNARLISVGQEFVRDGQRVAPSMREMPGS